MSMNHRLTVADSKFEMRGDAQLPTTLSNAVLSGCWFFACHFGMSAKSPTQRRTIRDIRLVDCKATNNSALGPAVVEDVDVNGLLTGGLCTVWGAVFRHVTLRGKCGRFLLNLPRPSDQREQFMDANRTFYEAVDWALDVSQGEFEELEIRGVPARLIRRDPETQVVVTRAKVKALEQVWRGLDLAGTPWAISLSHLAESPFDDRVLVAPKRGKEFRRWQEGLHLLQRAGVAEPS